MPDQICSLRNLILTFAYSLQMRQCVSNIINFCTLFAFWFHKNDASILIFQPADMHAWDGLGLPLQYSAMQYAYDKYFTHVLFVLQPHTARTQTHTRAF